MSRYAKLGILSIRWMAVGLFVLTALWLLTFSVGYWTMGSMMGQEGTANGYGYMMTGNGGMFWGPALLTLVLGVLLYALSRPIGTAIASGLTD